MNSTCTFLFLIFLTISSFANSSVLYEFEAKNKENPFHKKDEASFYSYNVINQDPAFAVEQLHKLFPDSKFILYKNNSLVGVYATAGEYTKIEAFLSKFDCIVEQIRIEVEVIEISKNKLKEIGLKWNSEHGLNANGDVQVLSDVSLLAKLKIANQKGIAHIKANPSLVVRDSCTAIVNIGDRVPYTTQSSNSSGVVYSVSYMDAGLSLEIRPRVVSGNYIHTVVSPKLSSIKGWKATSSGEYPIISNKEARTEVTVRSNQVFIIAGLKSESVNQYKYEIPVLSSIPFIGNLFSFSMSENSQSEIVFCIKPTIIKHG